MSIQFFNAFHSQSYLDSSLKAVHNWSSEDTIYNMAETDGIKNGKLYGFW